MSTTRKPSKPFTFDREAWLRRLHAGSPVMVQARHANPVITTVDHITPTGRIVVAGGQSFGPNGIVHEFDVIRQVVLVPTNATLYLAKRAAAAKEAQS